MGKWAVGGWRDGGRGGGGGSAMSGPVTSGTPTGSLHFPSVNCGPLVGGSTSQAYIVWRHTSVKST